jgi:integration host factor subunit alpha
MTLTKTQIVDEIHQYMFWDSRKKTVDLVEILLEIMKRTLESGEDLLISNFGKFCVKEKSGRKGRNPATGEKMIIAPRKVVAFKCAGRLRDKINGQEKHWWDKK